MRVSEFNNIPKHLRDFRPKKGVSFGGVLSSTTYAELVRAIQRIVGLLYLGGDKSKREILLHRFPGLTNYRGFESPQRE